MGQENKPAKSQGFFQNNKAANHQKIKYTTTKIKFRTFLSNIAYIGINKKEYYNKNLPFDVYMLSTKNLNPFSLNRILADKNKHEMIYMLWTECIPSEYYRSFCEEKNFIYLNGKNVLESTVIQITIDFIERDKKNLKLLENNLARYKSIFQYVYSDVYPEIYYWKKRFWLEK